MTGEAAMTRAEVQREALRIGEATGCEVRVDEPLAPFVSMRVGGRAAAFFAPMSSEMLARAVRELVLAGVPHRLLGGGSNLLVADGDLDFAVVHSGGAGLDATWDGTTVTAPGGMPLAALLRVAMKQGMGGLEWAAGLPGSIGGAVAGNAGAFGGEIGRSVRRVSLLQPDGNVREHVVAAGDFTYRRSFVRPGEVVLSVTLELVPGDADSIRAEVDRVNRSRAGSQPKGGHSSGCIFKNPPGGHAGKLIDDCGLKGRRHGGAFVSPTHGNFILNDGTATAGDILALIDEVRAEVRQRSGVELELEVKVWTSPEGGAP